MHPKLVPTLKLLENLQDFFVCLATKLEAFILVLVCKVKLKMFSLNKQLLATKSKTCDWEDLKVKAYHHKTIFIVSLKARHLVEFVEKVERHLIDGFNFARVNWDFQLFFVCCCSFSLAKVAWQLAANSLVVASRTFLQAMTANIASSKASKEQRAKSKEQRQESAFSSKNTCIIIVVCRDA